MNRLPIGPFFLELSLFFSILVLSVIIFVGTCVNRVSVQTSLHAFCWICDGTPYNLSYLWAWHDFFFSFFSSNISYL
jgi:hypothetical protein